MFLTISSQRTSDISETIISQSHKFLDRMNVLTYNILHYICDTQQYFTVNCTILIGHLEKVDKLCIIIYNDSVY